MRAGDWGVFMILAVLTFAVTFAAAWVYGRYLVSKSGTIDPDSAGVTPAGSAETVGAANEVAAEGATAVASPLTGRALALSEVSDPMFAAGKLGVGVAVVPEEGVLRSPVDGTVTVAFPSGHAFAVRTQAQDGSNVDILMHIGFDTVNLKGEHFNPRASKGDRVRTGDVLCEFDIAAIKGAGYEVTTPVVVANAKKTGPVLPAPRLALPGEVRAGEGLLTVDPKPAVEAASAS